LNHVGAVFDAPGDDFGLHSLVNGGKRDFLVFAKPFGDVNRPSASRVIGAAEMIPDVYHPLPGVKNVVVFYVMVDGNVLAGFQFGFDGGDVVVRANFPGFRMPFVRVPDNQNGQRFVIETAAYQINELDQNLGLNSRRDFLLKAQGHAAIGLGKSGCLNQTLGLPGIAAQDLRGLVSHLVINRGTPALERLENHITLQLFDGLLNLGELGEHPHGVHLVARQIRLIDALGDLIQIIADSG